MIFYIFQSIKKLHYYNFNIFIPIECVCNKYIFGESCDQDTRPCSHLQCTNNGTCTNLIQDNQVTGFNCSCPKYYYGKHCEEKYNICQNVTCNYQGYCFDDNDVPRCKCFKYYSGTECEINAPELVRFKMISEASKNISIFLMSGAVACFIINDVIKLVKSLVRSK